MDNDVAKIAAGLTKAQRRVLCALPAGEFVAARDYSRHLSVRMALTNSGCTEPERTGPVTMWFSIRPTPLGKSVRKHLENTDAK